MAVFTSDLGGTHIKMALMHQDTLLEEKTWANPHHQNFDQTLEVLVQTAHNWREKHRLGALEGFGLSLPGIVDVQKKQVLSINDKYKPALGFDFGQWAARYNINRLVLENDARAATLGEWIYGTGAYTQNFVLVTLGTGIGVGAVINGQVLRGKNYQAAILGGHSVIHFQGEPCNCQGCGCAESEASSWRLPELIREHPAYAASSWPREGKLDFERLFFYYRQKDLLARELAQHCLQAWAACLTNLMYAYDPEILSIGGGLMASGDIILPRLRENIKKYCWDGFVLPELKQARLGNTAAHLGLAYLLRQTSHSPL